MPGRYGSGEAVLPGFNGYTHSRPRPSIRRFSRGGGAAL